VTNPTRKIDIGQTIGIFANVGVIAGIAFLAIEIGQNQRALDEQNMLTGLSGQDSAFELMSSWRRLRMQNPELERIWGAGVADELQTDEEIRAFDLLCEERIFIASTLYNRYEALNNAPAARNQVSGLRRLNDQSATFRRCWQRLRGIPLESGNENFVAAVERPLVTD